MQLQLGGLFGIFRGTKVVIWNLKVKKNILL